MVNANCKTVKIRHETEIAYPENTALESKHFWVLVALTGFFACFRVPSLEAFPPTLGVIMGNWIFCIYLNVLTFLIYFFIKKQEVISLKSRFDSHLLRFQFQMQVLNAHSPYVLLSIKLTLKCCRVTWFRWII